MVGGCGGGWSWVDVVSGGLSLFCISYIVRLLFRNNVYIYYMYKFYFWLFSSGLSSLHQRLHNIQYTWFLLCVYNVSPLFYCCCYSLASCSFCYTKCFDRAHGNGVYERILSVCHHTKKSCYKKNTHAIATQKRLSIFVRSVSVWTSTGDAESIVCVDIDSQWKPQRPKCGRHNINNTTYTRYSFAMAFPRQMKTSSVIIIYTSERYL